MYTYMMWLNFSLVDKFSFTGVIFPQNNTNKMSYYLFFIDIK